MTNSKNKRKKTDPRETLPQAAAPEGSETSEEQKALKADLLDDFLFNAANYIYVRRKLFITLAVMLVVTIFTVWGIFEYFDYKDRLRNESLFDMEQIIFDPNISPAEKSERAIPLLNQFLQNHEGTSQYAIALFYKAGLNADQKAFQDAENDLKRLLEIVESNTDLYFLASLYLANVLRDQNRIDEAHEVLQASKTDAVADIILMEQAEMYMNTDQNEKAKELLEILLKDYPKSLYANRARQLLDVL